MPRISDLAHVASSSRGKLELTMSEDDGQEDKLIGRIVAEAVKNVFGQLPRRPASSARRSSTSSRARGSRSATPSRSATSSRGSRRSPASARRPTSWPGRPSADGDDAEAREAATASAAEFILEGLHVHNKLNKSVKAGATSYKR